MHLPAGRLHLLERGLLPFFEPDDFHARKGGRADTSMMSIPKTSTMEDRAWQAAILPWKRLSSANGNGDVV
jgi:hypothetical protein